MQELMKNKLIDLIANRLQRDSERFMSSFHEAKTNIKTRFFVVDDLLPEETAIQIYEAFPKDKKVFRRLESFREHKSTSKNLTSYPPILSDITFAIQDRQVIELVEKITGIRDQKPDPKLYAGGLSMMYHDDYLNPHIDNSHDSERQSYRVLNLLYYVTPNWDLEAGGNFELWDTSVKSNITITSKFNRLVVMETNKTSWHSVNRIRSAGPRCCVSNYYFSGTSPHDHEYFHVTSFTGRPEQKMLRLVSSLDNIIRSLVRKIFRRGVGKMDVHQARTN